jgi:hypothetical protein
MMKVKALVHEPLTDCEGGSLGNFLPLIPAGRSCDVQFGREHLPTRYYNKIRIGIGPGLSAMRYHQLIHRG